MRKCFNDDVINLGTHEMLLEFGFRNYFSFKEGGVISFKLPKNCPKNISKDKDFTNLIGVKGKNASGKTNILKAVSFVFQFASDSFNTKPDEEIFIKNFYENDEDTDFYVEFRSRNIEYRYELTLNKYKVVSETLLRKVKRWSKVIERHDNEFTLINEDYKALKHINLRSNASFISTAHQYSLSELDNLESVYWFFSSILTNVGFFGLRDSLITTESIDLISSHYYKNPNILEFVKEIICECDTGVSDIEILTQEENGKVRHFPIFVHKVGDRKEFVTYHTESSGTKSLFIQLGRYAAITTYGGLLCLDEFDLNLHPYILPLLLNKFLDEDINVGKGQFLFSTHNNEILDFLGRYRTIFVDKQNNESFAYRLDDIPGDILRNDRPILPVYQEGKIGGIPNI